MLFLPKKGSFPRQPSRTDFPELLPTSSVAFPSFQRLSHGLNVHLSSCQKFITALNPSHGDGAPRTSRKAHKGPSCNTRSPCKPFLVSQLVLAEEMLAKNKEADTLLKCSPGDQSTAGNSEGDLPKASPRRLS